MKIENLIKNQQNRRENALKIGKVRVSLFKSSLILRDFQLKSEGKRRNLIKLR
jgi:hypothetical protein